MSEQNRFWVRFYGFDNGNRKVHSFDTFEEADWFAKQVNGEVYDYYYKVHTNYGFINDR